MHNTSFKIILAAAFVFCIISCNNNNKEKNIEEKPADTATSIPPPPPATNPPGVEMKAAMKKCFSNDGLKYSTIINLTMGETDCLGTVTSEELGSGKKETADFTGIISGKGLLIKFKSTPPVIGDASEWTDNVWAIKKTGDKETLTIPFNAKNYETNKWQLMDYEFTSCEK